MAFSILSVYLKYTKTKITINTLKGLPLLLLAFMLSCESKSGNQDKPENQTTEITEENNATYINGGLHDKAVERTKERCPDLLEKRNK